MSLLARRITNTDEQWLQPEPIANPEAWGAMASGLPVETVGVPLAAGRAWDIDTPDDLEIARVLFGAQR